MRLLHSKDIRLQEFVGDSEPPYAILSHTWEKEEVSLADMKAGQAAMLKGYPKILGSCAQALRDGYEWVWIDTCCIDRSSSAELGEAINSMYAWYERAEICYVYLVDVENRGKGWREEFQSSRWWTRGWTLRKSKLYRKRVTH